jgi:hypothetical protein
MHKIALSYIGYIGYNGSTNDIANSSINGTMSELYREINENKLVQTTMHYGKITTQPILVIVLAIIINTILLYSVFSVKFRIMIPIPKLLGMMARSILIKNNFVNMCMKQIKAAKHITGVVAMCCMCNFGFHIYELYSNYLKHIELIYHKIYKFRVMLQFMDNIVKTYKSDNLDGYDTIQYFRGTLSDLYEHNKEDRNWWFFFRYGGTIISDFYKISNKKNKLGKLFNINGQIAYLSL